MFGDAAAEGVQHPFMKVPGFHIAVLERFYKTDHTLLNHFQRQAVRVCLKWIRSLDSLGVNHGQTFVRRQQSRKNPLDEFARVWILQVDQMTRDIEGKSVLSHRAAQAADSAFL